MASTPLAYLTMAIAAMLPAAGMGATRDNETFAGVMPPGHQVVYDGRIWSCQNLTDEEIQLVGDRHLDTVMVAPNPEQSCLVKNTEGKPALIRKREVLPGSFLVTRKNSTGVNLLQTWGSHPSGIVTLTSADGGSIQLPQVTFTYRREFWKDGSPAPSDLPIKPDSLP